MNRYLASFALGVALTGLMALVALRGKDIDWQLQAYDHYAACFTTNFKTNSPIEFHWWDECRL